MFEKTANITKPAVACIPGFCLKSLLSGASPAALHATMHPCSAKLILGVLSARTCEEIGHGVLLKNVHVALLSHSGPDIGLAMLQAGPTEKESLAQACTHGP